MDAYTRNNLFKLFKIQAYVTRIAASVAGGEAKKGGMMAAKRYDNLAKAVDAENWMSFNSLCESFPGIEDMPADETVEQFRKIIKRDHRTPDSEAP